MKSFTAGKNEQEVRLSRFVESVTNNMPSALLYKSFRNKRIKVNGKRGLPDDRLCVGDIVEMYINDEFFEAKATAVTAEKKKQPKVTVIYEDENIAALYKPAHLLCHSDRTGDASLVDAFTEYLEQKGEFTKENEAAFSPAICNRLDRGTEGLVLAAKNHNALRDMNEIIRTDLLLKEYLCITCTAPKNGRYIAYLRHFEKDNKVIVRSYAADGYKQIITDVNVLDTKGPLSLCKIGLITGRTHQIRAHLAFLNAPVLGDIKYGNRKMNERYKVKTQSLCAYSISFKSIPKENSLSYLSDKIIMLEANETKKLFDRI
ncbi:MAG: RluA family pseudouridine synthase [Oscillospiraceae bacterium]